MVAGANMTSAPQPGMALINSGTNMSATNEQIKKANSDNRRSNKPIMEKRRRARINNCLNELKTIILDAMKKDPARHSKLEKADILEMTVRHLESLQRQQSALATAADPGVMNKFRAGYSSCAGEVGRFPGLDPQVRRRLMQHLAACLVTSTAAAAAAANPKTPADTVGANKTAADFNTADGCESNQNQQNQQVHILPAPAINQDAINNPVLPGATSATPGSTIINTQQQLPVQLTAQPNGGIYFTTANGQGVQLIPTRLPNGDIALILPNQQQQQQQKYVITQSNHPEQIVRSVPTDNSVDNNQSVHHHLPNQTSVIMPNLIAIPYRTDSRNSNQSGSSSGAFSPSVSPALRYESPPTPPKSSHNGDTPERVTSFSPELHDNNNMKPAVVDGGIISPSSTYRREQFVRCKSAESLMHNNGGEDRLRQLCDVADRYNNIGGVNHEVDRDRGGSTVRQRSMERASSPQGPLSLVMRRQKSYKAAAVQVAPLGAQDDSGACWRPW